MKKQLVIVAALAALAFPATLLARPDRPASPLRWSQMTLPAKQAFLSRQIVQGRTTVRWWISHRPETVFYGHQIPVLKPARCGALGIRAPAEVCARAASVRRAARVLRIVDGQLAAARRAAALPAHDALWECLRPHEGSDPGNRDTGHNGHWGGLQMHPGWGYGTSYHASDDPWIVQKQAAERGYAASGYSRSFLIGQWGETIGFCWNDV